MSESTRLVLVRHGEAVAAVDRVVGGHEGCTGLSDLGRRQVGRLRDRFSVTGFRADAIVTSVLPRAVETAEILADGLGYSDAIMRRCELCEIHPGEADGMSWDVVQERYAPGRWGEDPEQPLSPGGETLSTFTGRVLAAVDQLAEEHRGSTVLVPCHGGVITAATLGLLGVDFRWFAEGMANTAITEWVRTDGGEWLLSRFSDAAHLEGD